jgi:glutathione S-transferase
MTKPTIFGMPQSPLVWAVRMAAAEKGIETDLVLVRPHTEELLALQPFGKMPVLRHGTVGLGESYAIARYLDGLAEQPPLMPRDLAAAVNAEQWVMHFHTEYVPVLLGRYVVAYFFAPNGVPDRAAIDASLPAVEKCLAVLERQLGGGPHVAGAFGLADIFYAPLVHYVSQLPEGGRLVAASPNLAAWLERMRGRAAFQATFPPPMPGRVAA